MDDHAELADEHEESADRLERESERNAERADEARSQLQSMSDEQFVPSALGDEDPGHLEPSKAEQREERREQEAEEGAPDTIGEHVDAALEDTELGTGGERGRNRLDNTDETPGGGDYDDPPDAGAGEDDD